MKRDFQLEFLMAENLLPEHYLLDIGCGTLRGGIPIIDFLEKGHYYGIDQQESVIDEGRKELDEAGLAWKEPQLQVKFDRQFDFIWAFSVLIHMSDNVLNDTLDLIKKNLLPGGAFFANVNIGNKKEGRWQGFPVVWRTLEFYRNECERKGLKLSDRGSLRDVGHVSKVEAQDSQRMLQIVQR
jgi:SAM-dependent methyltransferase